eukprot:85981_1
MSGQPTQNFPASAGQIRNHSDCPIRENTVILSQTLKRTERPILSNMFSSSSRSKKWLKRSLVAMTLYALLILISIMRINLMSHPSETKNKDVHDILDTKSISSVKSQLVNAGSLNVSQSEKERPLSPRKWSTSKKILNKTYSQKNQDRGMYYRYFQNMDSPGTFIELGANDGTSMSNTKLYEDDLGWSGLCIEGDPVLFKSLKQNRPNCTNVHAIITDKPGNVTWKYAAGHQTGLVQAISGNDTLIKEFSRFPVGGTTIVKGTPLVDMLREHNIHHVDFFSLDVDGAECTLLKTIDFRKVDVRTFLIETHSGGKYGIRETGPQCVRDVLTSNGFHYDYTFGGLDDVYVNDRYYQ